MKNIVFGPVISRRFGLSLGVDLSPTQKQCNFDCLYCELEGKKAQQKMSDILDLHTLIQSVLESLQQNPKIDVLTITANGEPTLYPHLFEFMEAIKPAIPQGVATLILSNGSRFGEESVQKALHLFDIVKFSLDAAQERSFSRIDRPYKEIHLSKLLAGIESFAQVYEGKLVAEVLLVQGVNDNPENIKSIADFLRRLRISRVDLGTVDRPPAYKAAAIDYERLVAIAKSFDGMYVSLPHRQKDISSLALAYSKDALKEFIARRPVSVSEAPILFESKTLEALNELVKEKKLILKKVVNLEFYTIAR